MGRSVLSGGCRQREGEHDSLPRVRSGAARERPVVFAVLRRCQRPGRAACSCACNRDTRALVADAVAGHRGTVHRRVLDARRGCDAAGSDPGRGGFRRSAGACRTDLALSALRRASADVLG